MKKIINILILVLAIFILVSVIVLKYTKAEIELIQISAESKDSMMGYVIRTKNGKTIVIDGGRTDEATKLKDYVEKYSSKVDYWFITHPHADHVGAFIELTKNKSIQVDTIYYSANPLEWYEEQHLPRANEIEKFYDALEDVTATKIEPKIGDKIKIEADIEVEILGIRNPEITNNPINNSSMVFKLYVNNTSLLFLGDTGAESSQKLIEKYGENLKSDIVQMAHHGQDGATEDLYKLVKPEICLWPTPKWLWENDSGDGYNTGNWTTLDTRKWIENIGVEKHYTQIDGDIQLIIK